MSLCGLVQLCRTLICSWRIQHPEATRVGNRWIRIVELRCKGPGRRVEIRPPTDAFVVPATIPARQERHADVTPGASVVCTDAWTDAEMWGRSPKRFAGARVCHTTQLLLA